MRERRGGPITGATDQVAPFGSVGLGLRSVEEMNRDMGGLMAQDLDEACAGRDLEPGVQRNGPGGESDAAEGRRQSC